LRDGFDVVQELGGSTPVSYLRSLDIDEALGRGGEFYLADALGSSVALADMAGVLQTQYTYQAFGATSVTGAPTTNPFGWTGRELDGTGLQFLRARYYSPTLQRFISEDPIGFEGGDVNLYAYAYNNPIVFTDPSGTRLVLPLPEGAVSPECLNDPEADSPPEMGGRKPGVVSAVANAAKKLAQGVMRTLNCDPTLDLMPGGIGMAKGPLKGKNLFKSTDALRRHNKQFRDVARQLKLTVDEERQLHDALPRPNMTYQELLEFGKTFFNK